MTRVAKSTPCASEIKDATGVNLGPARPVSDLTLVSVTVPIRTVSEANRRDHWAKRAKRAKVQRFAAFVHIEIACGSRIASSLVPCAVTMTRLSARNLDDDNLRGALKAIRDGVADALAVDDRDPRVTWEYGQEKGPAGVRIEIRRRES